LSPETLLHDLLGSADEAVALRLMEKVLSEKNLLNFIEVFWRFVEPGRQLIGGWPLEAICEHLEAVTSGQIMRLLINVPPGFMKSLASNVFWPAWEWIWQPSLRYVCASYSQDLTVRDNRRFKQVILSDSYRMMWGNVYGPSKDTFSFERVGNDKTGWKLATSIKGLGTGERGDRVILDDPNNVQKSESDVDRNTVNHYFTEVLPTRLNDPRKDAIIVIQQRTHEEDVSGIILAREMNYEHLMIPMEYDSSRHCMTSIGWQDPRGMDPEVPGRMLIGAELEPVEDKLAWPERFPKWVVERDKETMGPYATAGQFQQSPTARGGGIFKRHWWAIFPPTGWEGLSKRPDGTIDVAFPPFDIKIASLDTAYTEKQEADYSALTIWGVWRAATSQKLWIPKLEFDNITGAIRMPDDERPKVMLLYAWEKRLDLHGPPDEKPLEMSDADWTSPAMLVYRQQSWGLVEWIVHTCRRYKVDRLLIESKAQGMAVSTEIERLHAREDFGVELVNPVGDKVARAYSVQHLFSNFQVYAPMIWDTDAKEWVHPRWCEKVIDQAAVFPKGKHDDLVDSLTQGLGWLRAMGMAKRRDEAAEEYEELFNYSKQQKALYDV
jgi:predicted phage terminase large subunit-like protein